MLYPAKVIQRVNLYPRAEPIVGIDPSLGTLEIDQRVDVLYVVKVAPPDKPGREWALVKSGVHAGWILASTITRTPFLMVDIYRKELHGKPPLDKIAAMPGLHGILLKATQGTAYPTAWFNTYWPMAKAVGGERYGVTWFRGAYLFLTFRLGGKAQAEYYAKVIEKAGGWDVGDVIPIVDIEDGSDPKQAAATAQQVIDVGTECNDRLFQITGRRPMIYGGSAIRGRGITDHMGAQKVWVARYGPKLPRKTYEAMGWKLPELWGWQYGGTGADQRASLAGYPKDVPGVGQLDISVIFAATFDDIVVHRVKR